MDYAQQAQKAAATRNELQKSLNQKDPQASLELLNNFTSQVSELRKLCEDRKITTRELHNRHKQIVEFESDIRFVQDRLSLEKTQPSNLLSNEDLLLRNASYLKELSGSMHLELKSQNRRLDYLENKTQSNLELTKTSDSKLMQLVEASSDKCLVVTIIVLVIVMILLILLL